MPARQSRPATADRHSSGRSRERLGRALGGKRWDHVRVSDIQDPPERHAQFKDHELVDTVGMMIQQLEPRYPRTKEQFRTLKRPDGL
jgi:hypothetical protein